MAMTSLRFMDGTPRWVERMTGRRCDSSTREHQTIARNDTSDAAGRWLLSVIPPQEVWKAATIAAAGTCGKSHTHKRFCRCRAPADAPVSYHERQNGT